MRKQKEFFIHRKEVHEKSREEIHVLTQKKNKLEAELKEWLCRGDAVKTRLEWAEARREDQDFRLKQN